MIRSGVNYEEIASPVVHYTTFRAMLALFAHSGFYERHLDCPKVFTHVDFDTPCYYFKRRYLA